MVTSVTEVDYTISGLSTNGYFEETSRIDIREPVEEGSDIPEEEKAFIYPEALQGVLEWVDFNKNNESGIDKIKVHSFTIHSFRTYIEGEEKDLMKWNEEDILAEKGNLA